MTNSERIQANNAELLECIEIVDSLPDADNGVDLPELNNEGSASDLMSGKELIGSDGEVVTGTFTIDSELSTVDELIEEIQTALQNKAAGAPADPVLQDKTITPTTSIQSVTADEGYDGLDTVIVEAIPSNYIVPSGTLTITTNGTHDVKNYASATVSIAGSGGSSEDSEILAGLLDGRIETYTNNTMSSVRGGLFFNCAYRLSYVSLPAVERIASYAFYNCQKLTSVAFPNCTTLGGYAFAQCSNLSTVDFPVALSVDGNAFYNCSKLQTISFPVATKINGNTFARCFALSEVTLPECTFIEMSAFASCSRLKSVNIPQCSSTNNYAFNTCSLLTDVSAPLLQTLNNSTFSNCYALSTISLPAASILGQGVFMKCYNLVSLYLMGPSVCKLSHSNVFTSTPIGGYSNSAGTFGSIYVPASLADSYRTATNWTYFSSRIVGLEPGGYE